MEDREYEKKKSEGRAIRESGIQGAEEDMGRLGEESERVKRRQQGKEEEEKFGEDF